MDAIRFIGAVALAGTLAGCAGTTGLDTGGFGTVPPAVVKPALPPVAQTIPAPSPQQVAVAAPRARIAPPPTVRVPAAPVAPPSYIAAPSRIAPPVVAAPPVMVQRAAPQYVPEPVIATVPAPVAIPAPAPVQVVRAPEPTYTPVGDMDAVAAAPAPPPAAPAAPAPTYEQVAQVRPVRPVPRVRAMAPIRDEPADSRADRRATNSELRQHARKGYRRNAALRAGGPASAIRSNFTPAFGTKLEQAALERLNPRVRYDARYVKIGYPWGDVDEATGVCTDVVIRSYRALGIDLQELVHEDMKRAFRAYPSRRIYGLTKADPNIDHRRVVNLEAFFERTGAAIPIGTKPDDFVPGDVVTWRLSGNEPHIGIVVADRDPRTGMPLVKRLLHAKALIRRDPHPGNAPFAIHLRHRVFGDIGRSSAIAGKTSASDSAQAVARVRTVFMAKSFRLRSGILT